MSELIHDLTIARVEPRRHLDATVSVPGSKSATARAMVMAALAPGATRLIEPADCDDSDYMAEGLRQLGIAVYKVPGMLNIGGGGLCPPDEPLFLGNSGTAMRFLTAACAALEGPAVLDGTPRMRQRPIADLAEALHGWGVAVHTGEGGCPPVTIESTGIFGGATRVRGDASSQYLTGLLLVAPRATRECRIDIEGELVSKPYIDMTMAMMADWGVAVENDEYRRFTISPNQRYQSGRYAIEADASGASYFFAAAAVAGGRVRVENLSRDSLQGDAAFPEVLARMGCDVEYGPDWVEVRGDGSLRGIDVDLNAMPDMAQTLAAVALFADGPTTVRNVANLRIKECDRIAATVAEVRRLGATAEELDDGFRIEPGPLEPAAIETYDDHRMAMSFAVAGLRLPGLTIKDPGCVSKTFPDFFARFSNL
jgi:3-phosphoshikimate 1-carboxyvinyltransferase